MHAVIEYIDRNLDQELDLGALANVAHFSAFHFHRLFKALNGEALGDYVRRRRLEMAAMRLRSQPRVAVLQIALAVGFGSAEAFTRAFRGALRVFAHRMAKQQERSGDPASRGQAMPGPGTQDWRLQKKGELP